MKSPLSYLILFKDETKRPFVVVAAVISGALFGCLFANINKKIILTMKTSKFLSLILVLESPSLLISALFKSSVKKRVAHQLRLPNNEGNCLIDSRHSFSHNCNEFRQLIYNWTGETVKSNFENKTNRKCRAHRKSVKLTRIAGCM